MSDDVRRARRAYLWVGVAAPLVLLGVAALINALWLPQLPDPVATHWNGRGEVDGTGPRWTVLLQPLIGSAIVAVFAVLTLVSSRGGATLQERLAEINAPQPAVASPAGTGVARLATPSSGVWSSTARFLGATALGVGALIGFASVLTSAVQRGLDDALKAPAVGGVIPIGLAVLVGATVLGWFLQPRVSVVASSPVQPEAGALPVSARAAWFGTVRIARPGQITLAVLTAVLVGITVWALLTQPSSGAGAPTVWILAGTALLTVVLVVTTLVFRVRVGADGLRVRSLVGWPSVHLALTDIARVEVVPVNPFAEFGGWGWRIGTDGRRGVVLRTGPALQVTQHNGRVFVVTVDGADGAAVVLEGLRARAADTP